MIGEEKAGTLGRHAFDKKLHSRITSYRICRLPGFGRRKIQRIDAEATFALYPQQFTTCRQKMDLSSSLKDLLGDGGNRFNQVLAAIEDYKQPPGTNEVDKLDALVV